MTREPVTLYCIWEIILGASKNLAPEPEFNLSDFSFLFWILDTSLYCTFSLDLEDMAQVLLQIESLTHIGKHLLMITAQTFDRH